VNDIFVAPLTLEDEAILDRLFDTRASAFCYIPDARDATMMRNRATGAVHTRTVGMWSVTVNQPRAHSGWFENNRTGAGGSVAFKAGSRYVTDYDGVYELPTAVRVALADLGYVLDEYTR
jgi:hypothetical protein